MNSRQSEIFTSDNLIAMTSSERVFTIYQTAFVHPKLQLLSILNLSTKLLLISYTNHRSRNEKNNPEKYHRRPKTTTTKTTKEQKEKKQMLTKITTPITFFETLEKMRRGTRI